jgi:putative resolvase
LSDALAMLAGVEVLGWAGISGVSRRSVTGWFHAGVLPVPARRLAAGANVVDAPERTGAGVAICAGVLSCGQRSDLDWQVGWLARYLTVKGIALSMVVSAVGSGRNGHRTLLSLLRDASAGRSWPGTGSAWPVSESGTGKPPSLCRAGS